MKKLIVALLLLLPICALAMDELSGEVVKKWDEKMDQMMKSMEGLHDKTDAITQKLETFEQYLANDPNLYAMGRQSLASLPPGVTCAFCYKYCLDKEPLAEDNPDKYIIVEDFDNTMIFVNQMPYADGHFLVLTKNHTDRLTNLTSKALHEHAVVRTFAVEIAQKIFKKRGLNTGVNYGEWAGGSVPHYHDHVIPRDREGCNFSVSGAHLITKSTKNVYDDLHRPFSRLKDALNDGDDVQDIKVENLIAPDDTE